MAKTKVKTKFEILDVLKNIVDPDVARRVGKTVIKGIQDATSKGRSPVRGFGRYEAYVSQRRRKLAADLLGVKASAARGGNFGYPDGVKGKNRRPVNLRLTGEMMDALDYRKSSSGSVGKAKIKVGILSDNTEELIKRVETHNEGNPLMNIPQRKFIANGPGEQYSVSIQRSIRRVYELRLSSLIRRSNKKQKRR